MKKTALFLPFLLLLSACGPETAGLPTKPSLPLDNDKPLSPLSAVMDGAPAPGTLPEPAPFAALPAKFDVHQYDSPVRNQSHRGVCTIFATTALMEELYIKEGTITEPDFSEQYLQWSVKNQVGAFTSSEGSSNNYNLKAIANYGIVTEDLWPYESYPWYEDGAHPQCTPASGSDGEEGLATECYTNGAPPQAAIDGLKYKLPASTWISSSTTSVKNYIYSHQTGVAVGIEFFYQAWNHRRSTLPINSDYWRQGFVTYPNGDDLTASRKAPAGHGILLVGWDDDLSVPMRDGQGNILKNADGSPKVEKGFFLFKNSWGTGNFGINNPVKDGYGWISYRYIADFGNAVAAGLPTNVPNPNPTTTLHYGATPALAIPDNDPTGVTSSLTATGSGAIQSVTVAVDITHTYKGDLTVEVTHAGTTVVLEDQTGGSADDIKATFTPADFNGMELSGEWTLKVWDNAAIDVGTLNAWSIDVATH